MSWKQYFIDFAPLLTFAAYTWAACYFFYRLNEKNIEKSEHRLEKNINETKEIIKEWRTEHKSQMDEWRTEHRQQIEKMDARINQNESHWREMFQHMSGRIDATAKPQ